MIRQRLRDSLRNGSDMRVAYHADQRGFSDWRREIMWELK